MRLSQAVAIWGGLCIIGLGAAYDGNQIWFQNVGVMYGALIVTGILYNLLKQKKVE